MNDYRPANPLVVQSDSTVLVEVASPRYPAVRDQLARFAELEKSPEHVHSYRITPLSLWNAAASGMLAQAVIACLAEFGKFELPENIRREIVELMSRYGRLKLLADDGQLLLVADDATLIAEILHQKRVQPYLGPALDRFRIAVASEQRGALKQALIKIGHPVEDLAGYVEGEHFEIALREQTLAGQLRFNLRDYQIDAIEVFHAGGDRRGGSGVIVLPCGAGKTVVGLGAMAALDTNTLILTPSTVAARQWIDEIIDKTSVPASAVGEYTGQSKQVRPITVSTYQTLTYRSRKGAAMPHMQLFSERDWGLVIYDEVHLLPAPVFRITADLQARRRLGLTATLVREDGRADEVFSLIGPKKYDVPWKDLELQGWIATADCTEIRVPMPDGLRMRHAVAEEREKHAIAATSPAKLDVLAHLLAAHADDTVLIIGQYLEQLDAIASRFDLPLVTGRTGVAERERRFAALRSGEISRLVVSKVANFSIDLPDANVAIQVSGAFGSRQEEAQRLGRILRPKSDGRLAHFYSIVSRDSSDQTFAAKRQMFLTEQGYAYRILYAHELLEQDSVGDE
ncbi:MAG: DEAD/DEAH box helicase [Chloroflexi bacterium]|nr:DEAD/DEAH box helicase [Chloroflexota bacterium]